MAESNIKAGVKVSDAQETVTNVTPVTDTEGVKRVASSGKKRTRVRKVDSPPKTAASKPQQQQASEFTTAQIADALAEVLTFPAVPCAVAGDEWAANHFTIQGREFANNIAKQSEKNATLRRWCERICQGEAFGMLLLSGVMYAVPPLIHWGIVPRPSIPLPGVPMPPSNMAGSTAAHHMSDEGNGSNKSNGSDPMTRAERHTP